MSRVLTDSTEHAMREADAPGQELDQGLSLGTDKKLLMKLGMSKDRVPSLVHPNGIVVLM